MEVVCPICDSRDVGKALQLSSDGRQWDIYGCGRCLVQFVYPTPLEEELRALYDAHYAKGTVAWGELLNPNYGRLSFPRQWGIIRSLSKKRGGRILDFGCGGGHFLEGASGDWEKYGVEIAEAARVFAGQRGVTVCDSLETMMHWGKFFDVIVMFATIEHLPNPREVVGRLSKLLKVGGLFAVMTGDVGSVKAKLRGKRWHLYTPPGHLYFFTAHSVDCLMESLGFRKVKHLYTDGGVTSIPFMPLNLMLRAGIEVYHRIPILNKLPLWDTYYGYYKLNGR